MAYDSALNRDVLFGGWAPGTGLDPIDGQDYADTWTWDGAQWNEIQSVLNPPPRSGASMAYDPRLGEAVLFGGLENDLWPVAGADHYGDTWVLRGSQWQPLGGLEPAPRDSAMMAFDPSSGVVVLFGGDSLQATYGIARQTPYLADTWTWDGSWHLQLPRHSPPNRVVGNLVFDPSSGHLILFGGLGFQGGVDGAVGTPSYLGDTWEWTGNDWIQLAPASSPMPRAGAAAAMDAPAGDAILFGGECGNYCYYAPWWGSGGDTWTWNGTDWTLLSPALSPSARWDASMAEGPSGPVLFGGYSSAGGGLLGDTWVWQP